MNKRNSGLILRAALSDDKGRRYYKKLASLKRRGLIEMLDNSWKITPAGETYHNKRKSFSYFDNTFGDNARKEYLIMFDIPEKDRSKRNYLRNQLKVFDYEQVQQSVWNGPGPLPTEFLGYLEDIEIKKNIIIYKTSQKIV